MEFYGIKGIPNRLIRSYLNNRYQRISINKNSNKYYSDLEPIRHGVPQGSILGPLFFLLYIYDLPKVISDISRPVLYADDTSITILEKDPMKFKIEVNTVLDKIHNWFQNNYYL
jgi:hypothetical protein